MKLKDHVNFCPAIKLCTRRVEIVHHGARHCENQSFDFTQVEPDAHTVGPVKPLPPHCPQTVWVGPGGFTVVEEILLVVVAWLVVVGLLADEELLLIDEDLVEVCRVVEVKLPFQSPRSDSLRTVGSLYTCFLKSRGL